MSRQYRAGNKLGLSKKKLTAIITAVAVIVGTLITLNSELDIIDSLTWDSLYKATGLTQGQVQPRTDKLEVHFIDVGQGESTLILTSDKAALIDSGEADKSEVLRNYLDAHGVEKLDYIIATHPHSDHIGALSSIIERYEVGMVIMPRVKDSLTPTSRAYEKMLNAISDKGLKITTAKPGAKYDIGDGLTILAPVKAYDDLNNYSVVCRLSYGDTSFLFTGDVEKAAELDIIEASGSLSSTVLQIAHHGSSTSSSKELLQAVNAEIAVISCGTGNSYGHPHDKVIDRLAKRNTDIYRTDLSGSVVITSDGATLSVNSEK